MTTALLTAGGAVLLLLGAPAPAWARWVGWFQWGTQGSYVHQFAHLLFFAALLFFIRELYRGDLKDMPGVRSLVWACWLLAWWNLDAVVGHALEWSLVNPVILGKGLNQRLLMEDLHTWLFYFTRLTHFILLVPAFLLFCRALRAMAAKVEAGE